MNLFSLLAAIFTGFPGIYLGFLAFRNFRSITKEEVNLRFLIMNSVVAGISGFLIFFSIILAMGFLDGTYIWDKDKFLGAIFISLVPGAIITVGSFIQALIITGIKKALFGALKGKGKDQ